MTFPIQPDVPPLRMDESGTVRVGQTRVLLDLVIHAFQDGATPETIVQRYPTLELADVYAVIAYYLRNRTQVDAYLVVRDHMADEVRKVIDSRQGDLSDIRARFSVQRSA